MPVSLAYSGRPGASLPRPFAELGGEGAVKADIAGAEVCIYLQECLLGIGMAQGGAELLALAEKQPGRALNAGGQRPLPDGQVALPGVFVLIMRVNVVDEEICDI